MTTVLKSSHDQALFIATNFKDMLNDDEFIALNNIASAFATQTPSDPRLAGLAGGVIRRFTKLTSPSVEMFADIKRRLTKTGQTRTRRNELGEFRFEKTDNSIKWTFERLSK